MTRERWHLTASAKQSNMCLIFVAFAENENANYSFYVGG